MARNAFNSGKTRPLSFRLAQLRKFVKMMEESRTEIQHAINLDLRKHKLEGVNKHTFYKNYFIWELHVRILLSFSHSVRD